MAKSATKADTVAESVDDAEIDRFSKLAHDWWDENG